MAETLKKLVPSGNYAVILGAETDPNSAFLRSGMTEAGIPKLGDTAGPIKVVFEKNTDNWDTTNAKNNMEAALNSTTTTTTSTPSCRRTTAWRPAWSPRSTPSV